MLCRHGWEEDFPLLLSTICLFLPGIEKTGVEEEVSVALIDLH